MMYKLTQMMLAAVAAGVRGTDSGDPTIVGGAPPPSFGAFATNGFGTGYMSSSGHFTFQNADQPAVSGAYIYHTAYTARHKPQSVSQLITMMNDNATCHMTLFVLRYFRQTVTVLLQRLTLPCTTCAAAAAAARCDPYTPGAYYALMVSSGANSDGSAAFIDQASCEHGAFSYASDGTTLQWTFALADPDFSTTCQALPSEAFAAPATASRIARVPDAVSLGMFCGLNYY
ncbi:hypothetical protein JKP88DRAFT_318367 [Tribonema minus]|uniref:Uncharacterized protein n=1 Tax=Tribonema minus TaxID=303371 RepID=A0A835YW74_9STRA|nr:hypothetical protein JKP88DRAFT_318367 [Tribonema minus]